MGLLPEFFMMLGIDIFLAMSLLTALLDNDFPQSLQYLFQGGAILGLGQLFISQGFITNGIFTRDPGDATRFWISVVYLVSALSNVIGLNIYLGFIRRRVALATTFSGTVTVPTVMTSLFFVSSFIDTGGNVAFTPATISILGISVAVTGLSIFAFLRQAARRFGTTLAGEPSLSSTSPATSLSGMAEASVTPPPGGPGISLPFHLPARQREWEEKSPEDEEGR